jgi:6-phosphogluconolactonase
VVEAERAGADRIHVDVMDVVDTDVGLTGLYQGRRRMTLTYPALNRSRCVVWLVTGGEKAEMLARLVKGDESIPAGRIRRHQTLVLSDREAAARRSRAGARAPDSFTDAETPRR